MDSTLESTNVESKKLVTEADFVAQAEEARTALSQFSDVMKLAKPSKEVIKAQMELVMKTIVRYFNFSWIRRLVRLF